MYLTLCSPSPVVDAIEHITERIVAKAAEHATLAGGREVDKAKK